DDAPMLERRRAVSRDPRRRLTGLDARAATGRLDGEMHGAAFDGVNSRRIDRVARRTMRVGWRFDVDGHAQSRGRWTTSRLRDRRVAPRHASHRAAAPDAHGGD